MLDRLQRALGLQTIPGVFFTAAIIAALFVAIAIPADQQVAAFFGTLTTWVARHLGWFYILSVTLLLIFLLVLALSRYGGIRLGADDSRPDYSNATWFTMLFAAGIGTILMFWGVAEPISHFAAPPFPGVEAGSEQAARQAMTLALYHFGLHTWTIFALPGLAIAYFTYRHALPMRISSLFYPMLGERVHGPLGQAVDVIAVLGTLFGVATSLGLGTLQLNSGLNFLFGTPTSAGVQVVLITVIAGIAAISVALGLDSGIRRLSQLNILLALLLALLVVILGPRLLIFEGMVETVGAYLDDLPWLAFWTQTWSDSDWQRRWTVFYWAWTISWAPYVGLFIARISRGRTIREFIGGVLLAPTLFTLVWFSIFGLAAIDAEMNGVALADQVRQDPSVAVFVLLETLPLSTITSVLSVMIIIIFFTTSADSASLVIDTLTRRDDQPSLVRQRVFWAAAQGVIAATLLLAGGLDALQNVITALGLPFCVLLLFMAVSLGRALHADYRGFSVEALAQGRVYPDLEASPPTVEPEIPEENHVQETADSR